MYQCSRNCINARTHRSVQEETTFHIAVHRVLLHVGNLQRSRRRGHLGNDTAFVPFPSVCQRGGVLTFSSVAGVETVLLPRGPHADAKQPRQDDEREEHGRESQGDLLRC